MPSVRELACRLDDGRVPLRLLLQAGRRELVVGHHDRAQLSQATRHRRVFQRHLELVVTP